MQAPDDWEHEPSPAPHFMEVPLSLEIDETLTIPFSWKVAEAESQNSSIIVNRLIVNDQSYDVDVSAFDESHFCIVYELWVFDESRQQYTYGWDSGKEYTQSVIKTLSVPHLSASVGFNNPVERLHTTVPVLSTSITR